MIDALHARFGEEIGARIGHGGEADVYAMSGDRVLRVYHSPPHHPLGVLAAFYDEMVGHGCSYALPRILDHGEIDGREYSVDVRIPGRPLIDALLDLRGDDRRRGLDAYIDGAREIASIPVQRPYFGEIVRDAPIRASTWGQFLHTRIDECVAAMRGDLVADVPGFDAVLAEAHRILDGLSVKASCLVHGDYFPGNVMIGDDLAVSGVIDFGPLTVMGDPMMDIASAVIFLETTRRAFDPADAEYLRLRLVARHGASILDTLRAYRAFYAIRLSNSKGQDDHLYGWCVRSLRTLLDAPPA